MRHLFFASIAPILVAALIASGCANQAARAQGPPPTSVIVAHAYTKSIALTSALNGQVVPLQQSTLSFQQSGPITQVNVNVGDRVRTGQLLAKIDDSTLRAQLLQDQAALAAARSRLAQTRANDAGAYSTDSASLASAKVTYDTAQLNLHRNQQLLAQGYVSQSAVDQTQQQFAAAQAQLRAAQIAERNADLASGNTTAAQADVKNAQAAVAQAQAAVDVVASEAAQTSLYAPFDGVITARNMDPGTMAGPTTPVLQISQIDTVYVDFDVPDDELVYARPGRQVTFATSSIPGRVFAGTIRELNAVPSQGTLSYLARIRQPNSGDLLRGGMLVTVTITKERHSDAIVVPHDAVLQTDRGAVVFIVNGEHARAVPVALGIQTDTESEVRSPRVTAGNEIIDTPPATLRDGATIIVERARNK